MNSILVILLSTLKKFKFILLITLSPTLLYSQKNDSTRCWSVSLNFSPNNYTYRTVKKVSSKPLGSYRSHPYKTSDQIPGEGFNAMFSVNYRINHFNFKTGLILDKYSYGTLPVLDTLYDSWHSIAEITTTYYPADYYLLAIPFRVEGSVKLLRFLELYAGIGSNSYFGGVYNNVHTGQTIHLARDLSLNATLGINLKFYNISIGIAPIYNHLVTPYYDYETQEGEADKLFLYSYGLEYHVNYTFNKRNGKN